MVRLDHREIMQPVDIAAVRRTGYTITGVQPYTENIAPYMDDENPKKRLALHVQFRYTDSHYLLEDLAAHVQHIAGVAFPGLQVDSEPIRPARPSEGLTVAGHTDDECAFEFHVKPAGYGVTIVPVMGNGAATGFLELYKQILEREVVGQQA